MKGVDPNALYESLNRDWPMAPLHAETEQAIFDALADAVNELILHDHHRLMSILYRIDVSEARVRQWLAQHKGVDASRIIAQLILEREKQKIRTREEWKAKGGDATEEEKW